MEERTYTLPSRYIDDLIEVMVHADDNDDAHDVYAYADDAKVFPSMFNMLGWSAGDNPVFIHCDKPQHAYQYIRAHALDFQDGDNA